jgi:hypothetical protein
MQIGYKIGEKAIRVEGYTLKEVDYQIRCFPKLHFLGNPIMD